jgi:hypothetical protein
MSFLDNSGDIILDAVLTDTGRRQLARGDGSFRIVKFAFGDDEVNYELYATGAAGANRDLDILQSPVFEAFTNNTSTMKSKLLTIANNNLLYLPVNKLNQTLGPQLMATTGNSHAADTNGAVLLSVDRTTSDAFEAGINNKLNGLLLADGTNYSDTSFGSTITSTSALGASGLTTGLRFIDTTVRITGFTTGYRVDIPVRLLKAF